MPRRNHDLSEYRGMWLFALFDLPVTSAAKRKRAAQFRKVLLREGFAMLQLSVYARYCASEEIGSRFVEELFAIVVFSPGKSSGVLQHSVNESPSLENQEQLLVSVEPSPSFLSGLG